VILFPAGVIGDSSATFGGPFVPHGLVLLLAAP
jgi:hypothetical protein